MKKQNIHERIKSSKTWLEFKEENVFTKILIGFVLIILLICLYTMIVNIGNPEFWREFGEYMKRHMWWLNG